MAEAAAARWSLRGSNVVVTGGTKGIGRACCVEMLALGANLLFCSRSQADVDVTTAELRKVADASGSGSGDGGGGDAAAVTTRQVVAGVACDVATEAGRAALVAAAAEAFPGHLDVLVNNVGTNARAKVEDVTAADYDRMFRTNVDSCFHLTRTLGPRLAASDRRGGARVVNVASVAGLASSGTGSVYAMTKAAMLQLTKNLACEWARRGVTVNAVAPWMTMTPLLEEAVRSNPAELKKVGNWTPMGRLARAHEIAAAVTFLSLPASAYMTGQVIAVDGGLLAQGFAGPCASYSDE